MKSLPWLGLVVLLLGIVSLVVPVPHRHREGVVIDGVSVGLETWTDEKVSASLSAVMIIGGLSAIIATTARKSRQ